MTDVHAEFARPTGGSIGRRADLPEEVGGPEVHLDGVRGGGTMTRAVPRSRSAGVGLVDATTVSGLVATAGPRLVVDVSGADEITRDGLELLASLQDGERVRVVGGRWSQVVAALLAAPLGEVGRLGVLARRLVEGGERR